MNQHADRPTPDQEPLFNIGAVARMTAIPEATLRIWERRYDFPKPVRTAGGHRLYTQHEAQRLQWVKRRVDEGMQVSLAVRTLHLQEREVSPPPPTTPTPLPPSAAGDALGDLRGRLLDALLAHDAVRADQIIADALVFFPLEALILDVFGPVLNTIGEHWSEGRLDVATEHFATNYLRHHLLLWLRTGPPAYPVPPVVLTCAPGELHEGSLLMLAVLLQRRRWPVIYLGQSMPLGDLASLADAVHTAAIVFVAMTAKTARALADWPRWLPAAAADGRPVVCYGGRAFSAHPELAQQVPGLFLGATLHEGVERLSDLLDTLRT